MSASQPSRTFRSRRWRWFYALAGVLSLAAAALNAGGPLQGLSAGCSVRVRPIDLRLGGEAACTYDLDLLIVAIPAVLGLVLLIGAWRYLRDDPFSRVATLLAALAALPVAAFPLLSVWWTIDMYQLALGPVELLILLLAFGVLGLALLAGWRTLQGVSEPNGPPHQHAALR